MKKQEKEQTEPPKQLDSLNTSLEPNTYQHIDTKLTDMERRLEAALTAILSENLTRSVTAGLKGIIDTSLKEALVTMSKNVDKAIEENPTVKLHGEQIDSLETDNMMLRTKVHTMEGNQKQITKKITDMERKSTSE